MHSHWNYHVHHHHHDNHYKTPSLKYTMHTSSLSGFMSVSKYVVTKDTYIFFLSFIHDSQMFPKRDIQTCVVQYLLLFLLLFIHVESFVWVYLCEECSEWLALLSTRQLLCTIRKRFQKLMWQATIRPAFALSSFIESHGKLCLWVSLWETEWKAGILHSVPLIQASQVISKWGCKRYLHNFLFPLSLNHVEGSVWVCLCGKQSGGLAFFTNHFFSFRIRKSFQNGLANRAFVHHFPSS